MNSSLKKHAYRFWAHYARPFLFVAITLTAFRSSIADWNDVPTGSMKPTILEGDRVFVNKLAYDLKIPYTRVRLASWGAPARGDIVVFFSPADGQRLVKRVIGLPGDVVEMVDDRLAINGKPADYQPLDPSIVRQIPSDQQPDHTFAAENLADAAHPVMITPGVYALRTFGPITVPPGHYFVMGDNRDNSNDSRFIGSIPGDRIVGRASAVVASLDIHNRFAPRWSRFFSSLP